MKRILVIVFLLTCGVKPVFSNEEWVGDASLRDLWRWNELELFDGYRIDRAALGIDGTVWFAHNEGLLEYDGKTIASHTFEGIDGSNVLDLYVASDGVVYMATSTRLFAWKDGQLSDLASLRLQDADRHFLEETAAGDLIVATGEGVYEITDSGLSRLEVEVERPSSLLLDGDENLWVVGYDGERSVDVYALSRGEGALRANHLMKIEVPRDLEFKPRLFLDSEESVWVIAPDESDRCYKYKDFQKSLAVSGLKKASLWWETIDVCETRSGEIGFLVRRRMGSLHGGVLEVYDFMDFPIPSSPPYLKMLPDDRLLLGGRDLIPVVVDLSEDRWVTYDGLNFQCEDLQGGAWFISRDHEVVSFAGERWTSFGEDEGMIDWATRVVVASDGRVWVSGAHEGHAALSYRNSDGTWERFEFPEVGKFFSNLAAIETRNGVMIFGNGTPEVSMGDGKGGAVVFQRHGDRYESLHVPPPAFDYRTANLVERLNDGLWFSSGVVSRSPSSGQFYSERVKLFQESGWIDHMIVDRDNNLWIAYLGVGVYRFDGEQWRLFDKADGLSNKNTIFLLDDVHRDQILVLTEEGLFRFEGEAWKPWGFRVEEPFLRENHTMFQSADGAIWLNFSDRSDFVEPDFSDSDYHSFYTIRYMPESDPPETYVSIERGQIVEGSVAQANFDAMDQWDETPVEELEYSWSLDGVDWSAYSRSAFANIKDVPPGDYTLQVRSVDRRGNVDTSPAFVGFTVIPVLWKRGWFIATIILVSVTVVMLVYLVFKARVKAAIAIEEFKLDFFTNISHEMRNPLAVIVAPIDRLLRTSRDGEVRHDLRVVLRNVRKMQSMVDQLLEFRKVEKGKWRLNVEEGEVIGFIRDAISNFEPLSKDREVMVEFVAEPESCLCSFDHDVLLKVVDNLVSNAIKFSSSGDRVRVQATVAEVDSHIELSLSVEDEGPGIPTHEQGHVLKPFYRAKGENDPGGIGVGLAMVDQLVRLSGGTIHLSSPVPGKSQGTRFAVILPLDERSELELFPDMEAQALSADSELPRVLIVEDNDDFRYLLRKELSDRYRVEESSNGEDGLERAARGNPDIIVSDVMMPGLGGVELCEKLKTDPETSHIPVILLTAKSSIEHRVAGIRAGADAYIPKPLEMQHLRARIENLLEVRRDLRRKFARQVMVEPTEVTISSTDEMILRKAMQVVEENLRNEDFDVAEFAHLMGMSQSSLTRKLKAMMEQTPNRFIQKIRLKRAAKLLATGKPTVSEVACEVGIYDVGYFGKLFRKEFGETPSRYFESQVGKKA